MQTKQKGRRYSLALVALLLAGGALAAQDVKYNFMPGTDFSKYHTYKWVPIEGGAHPNQIMDAEIKQAVDAQLSAKGLTVDQEKQWNAYGMGGGIRWGGGMATATQSTINVGTLVRDMYDPSTKQLVWTGKAPRAIDPSSNRQKNQKHLNKAMEKLLKNYPPKQK